MASSRFHVVPLPGLASLLGRLDHANELCEVLKFLGIFIARVGQNNPGSRDFFEEQLSRYDPTSSVALALRSFSMADLYALETAINASFLEMDFWMITNEYYNPFVTEVKEWLILCALAASEHSAGDLTVKLDVFLAPQPNLVNMPRPAPVPHEVAGSTMPEMARAIYAMATKARDSGMPVQADDAFHILREFMRLALNCAQVWKKYGPSEWNFATEGMPQLSEATRFTGVTLACIAWRGMIENPFSEAPLHVRRILAQCNMYEAANYFLVGIRQPLNHPFPTLMNMDRLEHHFVQQVQWAAEDMNYEMFYGFRAARLENPFLYPMLPRRAFSPSLDDLDTNRDLRLTHGLPQPSAMELPYEDDIEIPIPTVEQGTAPQAMFDALMAQVFGPDDPDTMDEDPEDNDEVQQPLLNDDSPVYAGEFHLAAAPQLVAVGPRKDAHQYSDSVDMSRLQEDEVCLVCQISFVDEVIPGDPCVRLRSCGHKMHLKELVRLINGAYWQQPTVRCPGCRSYICDSRETLQVPCGHEITDE